MNKVQKSAVKLLKQTEILSAAAVRLTKITGKSKTPIHPKHLLREKLWFIKFLNNSDVLLDLGCNNGQNTIKSAKVTKKVVGVDFDQKLLEIAKITASHKNLKNISFTQVNLEKKISFKNESFSKVLLLDVLEHIKNRKLLLSEIHRILKKNGQIILGVPNSQTSWKKLQRRAGICSYSDPDHKIEFTQKSIQKTLQNSGFKIIYFSYGKYDTPVKGIIDLVGSISLPIYKQIAIWRTKKSAQHNMEASGFEIVARKI